MDWNPYEISGPNVAAFRSLRTSTPPLIEWPPAIHEMESANCSRFVPKLWGPKRLDPVWPTRLPPCQMTRAGVEGGASVSRLSANWTRASLTTAPPIALASDPVPDRVRKYARPSLGSAG